MIITLRGVDDSTIRAWTTRLIKDRLDEFEKNLDIKKYIVSFEKRTSEKKNDYYAFKIICK